MASPKPVFLALPDHNEGEIDRQEALLRSVNAVSGGHLGGKQFYVPNSAVGVPGVDVDEETYVEETRAALEEAEVVLACLDGRQVDDGTAWAVGFAHAGGTPVVGYWTERRQVAHPWVTSACSVIVSDVRELVEELVAHAPSIETPQP